MARRQAEAEEEEEGFERENMVDGVWLWVLGSVRFGSNRKRFRIGSSTMPGVPSISPCDCSTEPSPR